MFGFLKDKIKNAVSKFSKKVEEEGVDEEIEVEVEAPVKEKKEEEKTKPEKQEKEEQETKPEEESPIEKKESSKAEVKEHKVEVKEHKAEVKEHKVEIKKEDIETTEQIIEEKKEEKQGLEENPEKKKSFFGKIKNVFSKKKKAVEDIENLETELEARETETIESIEETKNKDIAPTSKGKLKEKSEDFIVSKEEVKELEAEIKEEGSNSNIKKEYKCTKCDHILSLKPKFAKRCSFCGSKDLVEYSSEEEKEQIIENPEVVEEIAEPSKEEVKEIEAEVKKELEEEPEEIEEQIEKETEEIEEQIEKEQLEEVKEDIKKESDEKEPFHEEIEESNEELKEEEKKLQEKLDKEDLDEPLDLESLEKVEKINESSKEAINEIEEQIKFEKEDIELKDEREEEEKDKIKVEEISDELEKTISDAKEEVETELKIEKAQKKVKDHYEAPVVEEKKGFFAKIKQKITTKKISQDKFEEMFWDLELALLENGVAVEVIEKIKEDLKEQIVDKPIPKKDVEKVIINCLMQSIKDILDQPTVDLIELIKKKNKAENKPFVICFVGVNGAGKTTTIAKLVHYLKSKKLDSVIAAADTFRAAAIDQLEIHADKLKTKLIKHDYNADPAAVAFDAIKHAEAAGKQVVLIDTAGRLHSNNNLMEELHKIIRVSKPDMTIFLGESITGNDCIEQAREFDKMVDIDGIILSKADIDEKGGAAISISYVLGKPILYLGVGQEYGDLKEFTPEYILEQLSG